MREEAPLLVVFISDEEDCGEVGDVTEGILRVGGDICYYASVGRGPNGEQVHPDDPNQKPYQLTPVSDYYLFLTDIKKGQIDKLFVAAIVGIEDIANPFTTGIEYRLNTSTGRWEIADACISPGCSGNFCNAKPGTRYLKLVNFFQDNGLADTICQTSFQETMRKIGKMPRCPRQIPLLQDVHNNVPDNIYIDGRQVPRYTCSTAGTIETCTGPEDFSCSQGSCVETWGYQLPTQAMPLGSIRFASHFSPCLLAGDGEVNISMD